MTPAERTQYSSDMFNILHPFIVENNDEALSGILDFYDTSKLTLDQLSIIIGCVVTRKHLPAVQRLIRVAYTQYVNQGSVDNARKMRDMLELRNGCRTAPPTKSY